MVCLLSWPSSVTRVLLLTWTLILGQGTLMSIRVKSRTDHDLCQLQKPRFLINPALFLGGYKKLASEILICQVVLWWIENYYTVDIPRTKMTSMFEGQPSKTRPKFQSKQGPQLGSRYRYCSITMGGNRSSKTQDPRSTLYAKKIKDDISTGPMFSKESLRSTSHRNWIWQYIWLLSTTF